MVQDFTAKLQEDRRRWEELLEKQRQASASTRQSLEDLYGIKLPQDDEHDANRHFSSIFGNAGDHEAALKYRAYARGIRGFVLLPQWRL